MGNGFLRSVYIWVDSSIITAKADGGGSNFWSNNERTHNSRCRGAVEVGAHSIEFCFGMMIQRVSNGAGIDMDPCHLDVKPGLLAFVKARARPVRDSLFHHLCSNRIRSNEHHLLLLRPLYIYYCVSSLYCFGSYCPLHPPLR